VIRTVELASGQSAVASYRGSTFQTTERCPGYSTLQLIPPDSSQPIPVAHPALMCDSLEIGPLSTAAG
jgi:hypothetical protein